MLHELGFNIIRNFYVCKYSIKRVAHRSVHLKLKEVKKNVISNLTLCKASNKLSF